jgi:hypothetical protein
MMEDSPTTAVLTLVACVPSLVLANSETYGAVPDEAKAASLLQPFLAGTPEGRVADQADDYLTLAFSSADTAFGSACLFAQQWAQSIGEAAEQIRFRSLLDLVPPGPEAVAALAAALALARELPARRLFATLRFIQALPAYLRAKFRIVGSDASLCGTAVAPLFESRCAEEECTQLAIPTLKQPEEPREHLLRLRWRGQQLTLDIGHPPIALGRGAEADVRIRADYVSRIHARIAFVQTNFVLYDASTNGTYVRIDEDEEKFLHQEQIVLRGSGVLSLGRSTRTGTASLVYFNAT